jgi:hypothetical protein
VRHERPRFGGRDPVPSPGGTALKALRVGLCALVVATQAAAAASGAQPSTRPAEKPAREASLEARLKSKVDAARRYRGTISFFENHRSLLRSGETRAIAREALARAHRGLKRVTREAAYYRRLIRERDARRESRRLAVAPPRVAIRAVFGRYADQALEVAWCESRLTTTAQNGQYLGLFQMGSSERRLFGHGTTAYAQSLAAHRYFVRSGRDWSPWSCRWAAF